MKSTVFENFIDTINDGISLFAFLTKRRLKTIEEMNCEIQLIAQHKTIHEELARILNNLKVYNTEAVKSEIFNEAKNDEQIMSRILKAYKFRIKDTVELTDRVNFFNPQKMAFFNGRKDNETEVNKINIKLYELFSIIYSNLINWNAMEQEINEFIGGEPQPKQPEQPNTLPKELDTDKAKALFQEVIKLGFCVSDGNLYQWRGTSSLLGYFVDVASDYLDIRPCNGRLPWRLFRAAFQCNQKDIATARQAVNDYRNNGISEPEGFIDIKKLCK